MERLQAKKRMQTARVHWEEGERKRERERERERGGECAWEEVKANGATKVSAAKSATDYQ